MGARGCNTLAGGVGDPPQGISLPSLLGYFRGGGRRVRDGVGRGLEAEVLAVGGEIAFDDGVGGFVRGFAVDALVSRPSNHSNFER